MEAVLEQKLGAQRVLFGVFRSWWTDLIELHRITPEEYTRLSAEGKLPSLLSFSAQQYKNISSIDNFGLNARVEGSVGTSNLRYGVNGTAAFTSLADPEFGVSACARGHAADVRKCASRLRLRRALSVDRAGSALSRTSPRGASVRKTFERPPYVDPQLELRLTVSGPVPFLKGLTYRASLNYAFSDEAPYIVGRPVDNRGGRTSPTAQFAPVDPFRGTVGLQYDFLP